MEIDGRAGGACDLILGAIWVISDARSEGRLSSSRMLMSNDDGFWSAPDERLHIAPAVCGEKWGAFLDPGGWVVGGGWAGLAESGWAGRSAVITGHLSGQLGVTRGRGVVSTGSGVDGVIHTPEGEGGGGAAEVLVRKGRDIPPGLPRIPSVCCLGDWLQFPADLGMQDDARFERSAFAI